MRRWEKRGNQATTGGQSFLKETVTTLVMAIQAMAALLTEEVMEMAVARL
jgi:hypothetical protein